MMLETISFSGLELRFLQTKESTGGSLDLFEMVLQPKARMPVPHHHLNWEETVYGLVGTTTWLADGRTIEVAPGESLFIPRGMVHGFDNPGDAPATCLIVLSPGVLGPGYFREMAALAAAGPPDLSAMKATMLRHGLIPAAP
jgi:quercetin dioxygenase-like cupin family protein